jgi:hypothetical protein
MEVLFLRYCEEFKDDEKYFVASFDVAESEINGNG